MAVARLAAVFPHLLVQDHPGDDEGAVRQVAGVRNSMQPSHLTLLHSTSFCLQGDPPDDEGAVKQVAGVRKLKH
eukprot:176279-Chlamydomonas_euryale.AAC.3